MPPVRRLTAILAADVVGYSWLMGLDEAGTAQALRKHRAAADPLITQHGGRSPDRRVSGAPTQHQIRRAVPRFLHAKRREMV